MAAYKNVRTPGTSPMSSLRSRRRRSAHSWRGEVRLHLLGSLASGMQCRPRPVEDRHLGPLSESARDRARK